MKTRHFRNLILTRGCPLNQIARALLTRFKTGDTFLIHLVDKEHICWPLEAVKWHGASALFANDTHSVIAVTLLSGDPQALAALSEDLAEGRLNTNLAQPLTDVLATESSISVLKSDLQAIANQADLGSLSTIKVRVFTASLPSERKIDFAV